MRESTITAVSLRTATILLVFTLVFTGLMAATYSATKPAIEAAPQAEKMKLIDEVLPPPPTTTTCSPTRRRCRRPRSSASTTRRRSTAPARAASRSALVLEAVAPDGYCRQASACCSRSRADGRLSGVRVTQHKETPGLGDYIDPKKDKNKERRGSRQFNGHGLQQMTRKRSGR